MALTLFDDPLNLSTGLDVLSDPVMSTVSTSTATTSTGTDWGAAIVSAFNRWTGIYEKGVDAKIDAAETALDYPKIILTTAVGITAAVLLYKILMKKL